MFKVGDRARYLGNGQIVTIKSVAEPGMMLAGTAYLVDFGDPHFMFWVAEHELGAVARDVSPAGIDKLPAV